MIDASWKKESRGEPAWIWGVESIMVMAAGGESQIAVLPRQTMDLMDERFFPVHCLTYVADNDCRGHN